MKIPLTILAIVILILAAFQLFAPPPDPTALQPRTDLPWQITVRPDGSSRVFDLDLGHATLADAVTKFGAPEGLAVFEPKVGHLALEAYFGNVQFGPLKAKVLVALEAGEAELIALKQTALDRQGSPSGDWKYPLGDAVAQHAGRKLSVITYIPGTRSLDPDFFRERFGEPAATLRENEQAQSWFYPEKGLSILIDEEAREVLEYQPPRKFVLPAGVTPNPKAG
jgi:hypothetical protein